MRSEHCRGIPDLHLAADGRSFVVTASGRLAPLRLDFAIERARCTWWLLSGWEAADVEALHEALARVDKAAPVEP